MPEERIEHRARSIACLRWWFVFFPMRCLARHSHKATAAALCALLITIFLSLLLLIPGSSLAGTQTDKENKRTQIEQIEIELKREKEKLLKFNVKEKDILEQLSQIEKEINEKRKNINKIRDSLADKKKELKKHRKKQDELESSLKHIEDMLAERLAAFYKNAKRSYIKVLLSTEDLDLLNHIIKYLRVIMSGDRAMMNELARKKADYNREMSIIEEQLEAVAHLEESENTSLTGLKSALEKEVLLLANIHREKEFHEVAVKELQSAADNLKDTISNLDKNAEKSNMIRSTGFGKSKGKLPLPCKGRIIKRVKRKVNRSMAKQKGIYIGGSFGSEVKAVYQGRVEYSGILKGYGQVIVINHGERYFTVSAYLSERKKSRGDAVLAGDTIGFVGEAGLTTGPALYFEIRKGEENLDPLKWLKD